MSGAPVGRNYDHLFKLILIGNSGVGKTCCLSQFTDNNFVPSFISTIGIDFKMKTIELHDKKIKLQIWDTAGQERFKTITTAYYRQAIGVFIVYDVCDEASFRDVQDIKKTPVSGDDNEITKEGWYTAVAEKCLPNATIFLIGNKCDYVDRRQVSTEEGAALANELGIGFLEVSAKDSEQIKEMFYKLSEEIYQKMETSGATIDLSKEDKVNLKETEPKADVCSGCKT